VVVVVVVMFICNHLIVHPLTEEMPNSGYIFLDPELCKFLHLDFFISVKTKHPSRLTNVIILVSCIYGTRSSISKILFFFISCIGSIGLLFPHIQSI